MWDLQHEQLAEWCEREDVPSYRARQIFRWLYRKGAARWEEMTDLPQTLRHRLSECFSLDLPTVRNRQTDPEDRTEKLLLELRDGRAIECVIIPRGDRADPSADGQSLCVSTQVGCGFACRFCATGRMGLVRDLFAGEIVAQVVLAQRLGANLKRVVLMGMGEPLHNYDNVMAAIRILCAREGFAWSPRRITLSTVGLVPEIYRLAQDSPGLKLAVSLHGTTDQKRSELIPVAQVYPLDRLFDAIRHYHERDRRRISFEYLLIRGANDGLRDAQRLARLLRGLVCHVNLIPCNHVPRSGFARPSGVVINRFAKILRESGIPTTIRASRGRGVSGACGQLVTDARPRSHC